MEKEVKRTPMRKAVDRLIADGRIKQDKDLQKIFNLGRSTISAYLNGTPGKAFVREFEKYFELSLKEFEENDKGISPMSLTEIGQHIIDIKVVVESIFLTVKKMRGEQLKVAPKEFAKEIQDELDEISKLNKMDGEN